MGPGQGRGKGEDPEKSGVPDYLVTKEHGEELIGLEDLPKLVPPVIGGDYDAPEYQVHRPGIRDPLGRIRSRPPPLSRRPGS
jgi:hypothetical protein